MSRTVKTTHRAIFDYWKDKAISEHGNVYIDFGYDGCDEHLLRKVKAIGVVYDWGEPRCFACNCSVGAEDNPDYEKALQDDDTGGKIWSFPEAKRLQRCHIKPASLGGEDKPQNLFLLCPRCHRESPDTKYPRQFFRWVYERRQQPSYSQIRFNNALKILDKVYDIKMPQFSENLTKRMIDDIGLHGGSVVDSSIVSAYVEDALQNNQKISLLE